MEKVQGVLSALIIVTVMISVYYSFRYRREREPRLRGLYASRMNIAMGLMLVVIAVSQLFFFTDTPLRRIFGTVCLIIGVYNLFAGLRNHGHYSRLQK
ncbi:YtpI family protein [Paenibacillus sp. YYML68]|uniref:YtpI family protein n=1 Tax=Paenibacillus sp. YYML68 TaxID=2909250 RepID=UPI0024926D64|nr:YtpI family protein [Paenibacillus sp. YYML68]